MKVYEIIPGLYQRGSFSHIENKFEELQNLGVSMVVNVRTKKDSDLNNLTGINYLHVPLKDGKNFPEEAKDLSKKIYDHIKSGGKALVYCNAGRNRSSLVSAMVLRQFGFTGAQAIQHIKNIRIGAFGSNKDFASYIEQMP